MRAFTSVDMEMARAGCFVRGCMMSKLWYDATGQLGYRMILVEDFHDFGIKISFGMTNYLGYGRGKSGLYMKTRLKKATGN